MMKRNPLTFPTWLRLAFQLLFAFLSACLVATWFDGPAGMVLGAAMGMALTLNLLRTWWLVGQALELREGLPAWVDEKWHGPLTPVVAGLNSLAASLDEAAALREGWIEQTRESAAQQERNRLARELHDSIKQQLFTINMSAAAAQARWEAEPGAARALLGDVRTSAHEAMAEMNALLQQLSPAPLEKVGLVQALRDQCEALGYRTGAQVAVEIGALPDDDRLPPGAQESLFRIAQEALSNIARHARAKVVSLHLGEHAGDLRLEIRDDGQGFQPDAEKGMGLANIRARARALGGRVEVSSTPGQGTLISILLPLAARLPGPETVLTATDHTFNKIFLAGLLGGASLIAALWYPFHDVVPGWLLRGWPEGSPGLGLILEVIAVLLTVGLGVVGARLAAASSRIEGAGYGALAGGTAGLIAYFGLGVVLAGLAGMQPLLARGSDSFLPTGEMERLMYATGTSVLGWVYGGAWAALLIGAGLGALGGALPAPLVGPQNSSRQGWRLTAMTLLNTIAPVSLFILAMSLMLFHGSEALLVEARAADKTEPILFAARMVVALVLATPLAVYLLAMSGYAALLRIEGRIEPDSEVNLGRLFAASKAAYEKAGREGVVGLGFLWVFLTSQDLGQLTALIVLVSSAVCLWQAVSLFRIGRDIRKRIEALGRGAEFNRLGWLRGVVGVGMLAVPVVLFWWAPFLFRLPSWAISLIIGGGVLAVLAAGLLLSRLEDDSAFRRTLPLFIPGMAGSLLGMILAVALPFMLVLSFGMAFGTEAEVIGSWTRSLDGYQMNGAATSRQIQEYFVLQPQVLLGTLVLAAAVTGVGMLLTWAWMSLSARWAGRTNA